ncbi:conserved hypothetical protein [Streptomyces sp. SPB78]|nr:hypothetical protein SSBG_02725 [Streptomyces sp. SPB074]EFK99931.1 conserved hypothetical protein [Streptomyces sp. SPB78]
MQQKRHTKCRGFDVSAFTRCAVTMPHSKGAKDAPDERFELHYRGVHLVIDHMPAHPLAFVGVVIALGGILAVSLYAKV